MTKGAIASCAPCRSLVLSCCCSSCSLCQSSPPPAQTAEIGTCCRSSCWGLKSEHSSCGSDNAGCLQASTWTTHAEKMLQQVGVARILTLPAAAQAPASIAAIGVAANSSQATAPPALTTFTNVAQPRLEKPSVGVETHTLPGYAEPF